MTLGLGPHQPCTPTCPPRTELSGPVLWGACQGPRVQGAQFTLTCRLRARCGLGGLRPRLPALPGVLRTPRAPGDAGGAALEGAGSCGFSVRVSLAGLRGLYQFLLSMVQNFLKIPLFRFLLTYYLKGKTPL